MENHGVLVGWVHHDHGERIMLRLETVPDRAAADRHEPDLLRVLISKQQAGVLGHYLLKIADQAPVDKGERGWFRRLFG